MYASDLVPDVCTTDVLDFVFSSTRVHQCSAATCYWHVLHSSSTLNDKLLTVALTVQCQDHSSGRDVGFHRTNLLFKTALYFTNAIKREEYGFMVLFAIIFACMCVADSV